MLTSKMCQRQGSVIYGVYFFHAYGPTLIDGCKYIPTVKWVI